jgi:hypothetical protein
MRGTASYLHHFVGYGGYARRSRLISVNIFRNEYMFLYIIMRRDIYYTAGLYSMLVNPWFVHRHIYTIRYQGIYIILTTVGRVAGSEVGSKVGSKVVREAVRQQER